MPVVFYLTHPQVRMDPAVPVPDWGLSEIGRDRAVKAAAARWTEGVSTILSSTERKAIETAEIIAAERGCAVRQIAEMGENDRSSTGYLPPAAFEVMADRFFANPDVCVEGWEPAAAAQRRITGAVDAALSGVPAGGDVLLVGHGGVGTLLMTALEGLGISRSFDQPAGGGNVFAFDAATRRVIHRWLALEDPRVGLAATAALR